jgi:exopolysaccharide biosynthesis polyprenyl glycosylphosphotransferase
MQVKRSFPRTQNFLLFLQIGGDCIFAFVGLALGYWLRFRTQLRFVGVESGEVSFAEYEGLLLLGAFFFVATYAYLNVYDGRLLLRPHRTFILLTKSTVFWFLAFLGSSLVLKFQPAISRLFVAISCVTSLAAVVVWRYSFYLWLQRSVIRDRLVQRVAFVGWTPEASQIVNAIAADRNHPYEVVGYVATEVSETTQRNGCKEIGSFATLEHILRSEHVDILIVADLNLSTEEQLQVSDLCERLYVQFKIMPTFFRIFVSSLRLQTISGVPVLGIEELHVTSVLNSGIKRAVDIFGAIVGLAISAPIMAILGYLVYRESPGPIIYRQVRTGRYGRPFWIFKLRSMKLNAEAAGAQWAVAGDPRRLKVGAFMREWNLDELPQFWNVLIGDMSLVGPRPERPELIEKFEKEIPHYNPRHAVRPGMTGWAQVNGLRGNTSLIDRIKYDLYYIENWSLWFDFQVLIQTFTRNKNAY